jgi:pimeloyl-ACP methyl ester carboxylesterase
MARGKAPGAGVKLYLCSKPMGTPYLPQIFRGTETILRPPATVTLKSYADDICQIASAQSEPVILVGHSMGGVAITQLPKSARIKLAHLYICAPTCRAMATR